MPRLAHHSKLASALAAFVVLLLAGLAALIAYWLIADRPVWVGAVVAFAIAAMAVRLLLPARDNRRIAGALSAALADRERMTATDPLTGLPNRSAIERALLAHAGPLGVIVLELETATLGFHRRDDVVTAAIARIRAAVGDGPVVARIGAAELALLVPNPAAARPTAERLRAAIAGEPFAAGAIGACAGVAWAPDHGATGEELLRAAEQARELARELGGNQVRARADMLDAALLEGIADEVDRRRGCEGHGRAVGRWAAAVAGQLALDEDRRRRCELAGRLHDIGLISAPDALLRRPQLTPRDDMVRLEDHPLAAVTLSPAIERALSAAAPAIVRHHDMVSANPPLEARIVAVCNAWASLREGRPGRIPLSVEAARAQLLTRSGTAYDGDVVRAFLNLELTGTVGRHEAADLSPARAQTAADEILTATASSAAATPRDAARAARAEALAAICLAGRRRPGGAGGVGDVERDAAHGGRPAGRAQGRPRRGQPSAARVPAPARSQGRGYRCGPALPRAAQRRRGAQHRVGGPARGGTRAAQRGAAEGRRHRARRPPGGGPPRRAHGRRARDDRPPAPRRDRPGAGRRRRQPHARLVADRRLRRTGAGDRRAAAVRGRTQAAGGRAPSHQRGPRGGAARVRAPLPRARPARVRRGAGDRRERRDHVRHRCDRVAARAARRLAARRSVRGARRPRAPRAARGPARGRPPHARRGAGPPAAASRRGPRRRRQPARRRSRR